MDQAYADLRKGLYNQIRNSYEKILNNKGVFAQLRYRDSLLEGIILGIESDGRLIINIDGKVKKLVF